MLEWSFFCFYCSPDTRTPSSIGVVFFLFGFNHRVRWDQGELSSLNHSWKVADGSATQTPATDYTLMAQLETAVWCGSSLLQRIVPTSALLVRQHCTVGIKSKWLKILSLCTRSFLFKQVFSLWHLRSDSNLGYLSKLLGFVFGRLLL